MIDILNMELFISLSKLSQKSFFNKNDCNFNKDFVIVFKTKWLKCQTLHIRRLTDDYLSKIQSEIPSLLLLKNRN